MSAGLLGTNPVCVCVCDIFVHRKLLIFSQLPAFAITALTTSIQSQGCAALSQWSTMSTIVGGGLYQS